MPSYQLCQAIEMVMVRWYCYYSNSISCSLSNL